MYNAFDVFLQVKIINKDKKFSNKLINKVNFYISESCIIQLKTLFITSVACGLLFSSRGDFDTPALTSSRRHLPEHLVLLPNSTTNNFTEYSSFFILFTKILYYKNKRFRFTRIVIRFLMAVVFSLTRL